MTKLSDSDKETIISKYRDTNITLSELGRQFNVSPQSILHHTNRAGLNSDNKEYNRKHSLDSSYFDVIDSKDKAYILGMIYSDGTIYRNHLAISLKEEDKYLLENIKECIQYTGPICDRIIDDSNYPILTISSRKLVRSLISLGLYSNKSLTISYPTNISYEASFIKGIFDGDGCVSIYWKENENTKLLPVLTINVGITGNITFLTELQRVLSTKYNITSSIIPKSGGNPLVVTLNFNKNEDKISFLTLIYTNTSELGLKRKYEKFLMVQKFFSLKQNMASVNKKNLLFAMFKAKTVEEYKTNVLRILASETELPALLPTKCFLCDSPLTKRGLCSKHVESYWKIKKRGNLDKWFIKYNTTTQNYIEYVGDDIV